MKINILIIDDNKKEVERLVNNLKRADIDNRIGECVVDDSIINEKNIEKYDPMRFGIQFDILMVDYQLNSEFTGVLVAAWIMLQMKIPKVTLTTGTYAGPKDCFDGFIIKDEFLDHPQSVISDLVEIVETFNSKKWLEKQHEALVVEYQGLIDTRESKKLNYSDEQNLKLIESLLDKFEKVLDDEQEKELKERKILLEEKGPYVDAINNQNAKIENLNLQLDNLLRELKENEE